MQLLAETRGRLGMPCARSWNVTSVLRKPGCRHPSLQSFTRWTSPLLATLLVGSSPLENIGCGSDGRSRVILQPDISLVAHVSKGSEHFEKVDVACARLPAARRICQLHMKDHVRAASDNLRQSRGTACRLRVLSEPRTASLLRGSRRGHSTSCSPTWTRCRSLSEGCP